MAHRGLVNTVHADLTRRSNLDLESARLGPEHEARSADGSCPAISLHRRGRAVHRPSEVERDGSPTRPDVPDPWSMIILIPLGSRTARRPATSCSFYHARLLRPLWDHVKGHRGREDPLHAQGLPASSRGPAVERYASRPSATSCAKTAGCTISRAPASLCVFQPSATYRSANGVASICGRVSLKPDTNGTAPAAMRTPLLRVRSPPSRP